MSAKIKTLHKAQGGKCYFCKRVTFLQQSNQKKITVRTATIEHLIPKSSGGSNRRVNLRMSCHECNNNRGDMCALEWLRIVKDPKKREAFVRIKSLRKRLRRIQKEKKFQQHLYSKYGEKGLLKIIRKHAISEVITI